MKYPKLLVHSIRYNFVKHANNILLRCRINTKNGNSFGFVFIGQSIVKTKPYKSGLDEHLLKRLIDKILFSKDKIHFIKGVSKNLT